MHVILCPLLGIQRWWSYSQSPCGVTAKDLLLIILLQWASAVLSGKESTCVQETQETWVWSLSGEDPLEEGMATHSSILARRIPWTEEPGEPLPRGRLNWSDLAHTHTRTPSGMCDLSRPGIELVFPALQGRVLTSGPPGKPSPYL